MLSLPSQMLNSAQQLHIKFLICLYMSHDSGISKLKSQGANILSFTSQIQPLVAVTYSSIYNPLKSCQLKGFLKENRFWFLDQFVKPSFNRLSIYTDSYQKKKKSKTCTIRSVCNKFLLFLSLLGLDQVQTLLVWRFLLNIIIFES